MRKCDWERSPMNRYLNLLMRLPILLLSGLVIVPIPAAAVLGDSAASVLDDQARMKGTLRSVDAAAFVIHEISTPSGTIVREYVSPAGAVFGVAWQGQFPPDLEQLLGPYYQQAKQAIQPGERRGRAPISIETPGLVVQQTGHPRSFYGQAYIPLLLPQSVSSSDIR
jgi:Protein of unknown function (DUF2844)